MIIKIILLSRPAFKRQSWMLSVCAKRPNISDRFPRDGTLRRPTETKTISFSATWPQDIVWSDRMKSLTATCSSWHALHVLSYNLFSGNLWGYSANISSQHQVWMGNSPDTKGAIYTKSLFVSVPHCSSRFDCFTRKIQSKENCA